MNAEDLINQIVLEKPHVFFVSPHLDDAALSCGGLLCHLADKTDVTVVSVFTKVTQSPYTLSARQFLKQCKNPDAENLFEERKKEDVEALNSIGVKTTHLGFVDASWRKKEGLHGLRKAIADVFPEFGHVYPTYRWNVISGVISKYDNSLMDSIKKSLESLISSHQKFVVFCPLGIGNHVDHVVVNKCCQEVFDDIIYWSDFPYSTKDDKHDNLKIEEKFRWSQRGDQKRQLVQGYKSQFSAIFQDGIMPKVDEVYYVSREK